MTRDELDDRYWQAAREVCTPLQLEALELRHRHNMALRGIALHFEVSLGTITDRIRRAEQKISLRLRDDFFKETAA